MNIKSKTIKISTNILKFCTTRLLQTLQSNLTRTQTHPHLLLLLQQDTNPSSPTPYKHYTDAKHFLQKYLEQCINKPTFNVYDPYVISKEVKMLSQLLDVVAKYPLFQLDKQYLRYVYEIFWRCGNGRTEEEMERVLGFVLRVDRGAEQSIVYREFIKHYLEDNWELLKATYQVQMKNQSLGNFLKTLISAITHRGFLRRTPNFTRTLSISNPLILHLTLQNPSTSSSLLLRKLSHTILLQPIQKFYREQMSNNLYHPLNTNLFKQLCSSAYVIFHDNMLVQKQSQYLREIFVKLFLVMRQQGIEEEIIIGWVGEVCTGYGWVKEREMEGGHGQIAVQFCAQVQQFIKIVAAHEKWKQTVKKLGINQHYFNCIKYFPEIQKKMMESLGVRLTPLLFKAHFQTIIKLFQKWPENLHNSIPLNNLLTLTSTSQLLTLSQLLSPSHHLHPHSHSLYLHLTTQLVQKDYKIQPQLSEILDMLKIYQIHKKLQIKLLQHQHLQTLRIFLFRVLADQKNKMTKEEIQCVALIVIELDDDGGFGDEEGNYGGNIYEELLDVVDTIYINTDIKQKFKSKLPKKQSQQQNQPSMRSLLQKLQSKSQNN